MSDRDDDILELADVREWVRMATGGGGHRRVALAIVLAVVGASLALGLVPHTLGAVGSDAVYTGEGIGTPNGGEGDAQQRYQNYVTNVSLLFAPSLVVMVACIAAFVAAARTPIGRDRARRRHVGVLAVAAGVGTALGYALFVVVSHLAFGEAPQGYIVDEFPVALRVGTLAMNAFVLAVAAGIGSTFAGGAGTLLADEASSPVDDAEPVPAHDQRGDSGADDHRGDSGGDDPQPGERRDRVGTADPASDYRETGPTADSDVPQYDPDDRDWDGTDD